MTKNINAVFSALLSPREYQNRARDGKKRKQLWYFLSTFYFVTFVSNIFISKIKHDFLFLIFA